MKYLFGLHFTRERKCCLSDVSWQFGLGMHLFRQAERDSLSSPSDSRLNKAKSGVVGNAQSKGKLIVNASAGAKTSKSKALVTSESRVLKQATGLANRKSVLRFEKPASVFEVLPLSRPRRGAASRRAKNKAKRLTPTLSPVIRPASKRENPVKVDTYSNGGFCQANGNMHYVDCRAFKKKDDGRWTPFLFTGVPEPRCEYWRRHYKPKPKRKPLKNRKERRSAFSRRWLIADYSKLGSKRMAGLSNSRIKRETLVLRTRWRNRDRVEKVSRGYEIQSIPVTDNRGNRKLSLPSSLSVPRKRLLGRLKKSLPHFYVRR